MAARRSQSVMFMNDAGTKERQGRLASSGVHLHGLPFARLILSAPGNDDHKTCCWETAGLENTGRDQVSAAFRPTFPLCT